MEEMDTNNVATNNWHNWQIYTDFFVLPKTNAPADFFPFCAAQLLDDYLKSFNGR